MRKQLCLCLFLLATINIFGTEKDTIRVVSYNVENLFDCNHDSLKNDYDFLPEGKYHWTPDKYKKKQGNIARVISSIGGWNPPALVGLVEIENEKTLISLTRFSPLKRLNYKFIHKESPDDRGIDVALLYQPNKFKPFQKEFIKIQNPEHPNSHTRDILYATGILKNGDTLHVFVNHFPSRLGGEEASENKRIFVAQKLRQKVDSILSKNSKANILIMGDFNDYPSNRSISEVLKAQIPKDNFKTKELYNLFAQYEKEGKKGSHKFKGEWGMLDQIIVSGNMLNSQNRVYTELKRASIYDADFLLKEDKKNFGTEPFRTYEGMRYTGGYSDHLPVYIDLFLSK